MDKVISIKQNSKCKYGLSKLDIFGFSAQHPDIAGESRPTIGFGYRSFFKNEDIQNCPITSCILKEAGCLKPYSENDLTI
jgi:hypothetical protein